MKYLEIIISVAATAFPFIIALVTCIIKSVKSIKIGKEEHTQRLWQEFAQEATEYAEALRGKNSGELAGSTKKEFALNRVEAVCMKSGIPFDRDKIDGIIEGIVTLTKTVNGRDKDKIATAQFVAPQQNILPLN